MIGANNGSWMRRRRSLGQGSGRSRSRIRWERPSPRRFKAFSGARIVLEPTLKSASISIRLGPAPAQKSWPLTTPAAGVSILPLVDWAAVLSRKMIWLEMFPPRKCCARSSNAERLSRSLHFNLFSERTRGLLANSLNLRSERRRCGTALSAWGATRIGARARGPRAFRAAG